MKYEDTLERKMSAPIASGFDIAESEINQALYDFQRHCVIRMLKQGQGAIFADCGLGKTNMQLEWAKQISLYTSGKVIIIAPLTVAEQTILDGAEFGYHVRRYIELELSDTPGIYITNYEQLENIDVSKFVGVVLDESSILKSFTGATKNLLVKLFKNTPYRLCCTATPSPNDLNEIGNHSEFLGVLDAQDMRSKWFIREEGMNNYRLKGHAKASFYGWISSWAIMFSNPADIGFIESGKRYKLPDLHIIDHEIETNLVDEGKLIAQTVVNATNFHRELKATMDERLKLAAKIANDSTSQVIIWIEQNPEGKYLRALLPDAVEISGSDSAESRSEKITGFKTGKYKVLITKPKICGFGMNFQNCGTHIFAAPDFSFEKFYQAIRRSHRFGRKDPVDIHIIIADTMGNVKESIARKQKAFTEMLNEMNRNVNENKYGLLRDYEYKEYKSENAFLMKGDSCIEFKRIPDKSIDLYIYSPPFSSLFTYSNYIHDMGNNESHAAFFEQYSFLLKELYRTLKPGRLMCCHTKDLGVYKNSSGYTGQYDFTRYHTEAVEAAGFKLHSKITIWTDPVLEMQRTKTQRLLYKQLTTDSSKSGVGMAEYITIFKKWDGEENAEPVNHISKNNFPLDKWQEWASPVYKENLLNYSPAELVETIEYMRAELFRMQNECNAGLPADWYSDVWFDIKRTDVLNGKEGTALGDEKHIAPLQLEVIRRCIEMWSNPGDTIGTPFLGIGSEPYEAILRGRKAVGCELKDSYFDAAVNNTRKAELEIEQQLFKF